jgi:hypothetical protein
MMSYRVSELIQDLFLLCVTMAASNNGQAQAQTSPLWQRVVVFLVMYWMVGNVLRGPRPSSDSPVATEGVIAGILRNNSLPEGTLLVRLSQGPSNFSGFVDLHF